MQTMTGTPRELGYRMPAEWEPHTATWLAWPHNPDDWPGKFEPIPWVFVEIVRHLHRGELVCIVARPEVEVGARALLTRARVDLSRVEFVPFATDRGWLRDAGAMIVTEPAGRRAGLDWHFNGWARYD